MLRGLGIVAGVPANITITMKEKKEAGTPGKYNPQAS